MLNRLVVLRLVAHFLGLRNGLSALGRAAARLLGALFGRWQWTAPSWLSWLGARAAALASAGRARPGRSLATVALLAAAVGAGIYGYQWYQQRPKPVETAYSAIAPELTRWDEARGKFVVRPLAVEFADSVAPLADVGKPVTAGVAISPQIAGSWQWETDRRLLFQPSGDWPVGETFKVTLQRQGLLAGQIRLGSYSFTFDSAPFGVEIADNQFYQDPQDPQLKKLVATVRFTHPVDTASLEKRIVLKLAKDAGSLGMNADATAFAVTYDKQHLNAFVHSHPLALPREDVAMTLLLGKGIRSARGGSGSTADISSAITVPGRYSLRFDNAQMTLIDNERFEPEQVLLFESSAPLNDAALDGKVQAWLLPEHRPGAGDQEKQHPYNWDASRVGRDIVAQSQPLTLQRVPGAEGAQTLQSFKLTNAAPVGRYVYIEVGAGVQAPGGAQSAKAFAFALRVEPYPRTVKLLGGGAILALGGERKLGFVTRGVGAVKIEIGRLLPNQLHQLVDANWGPFERPNIDTAFADRLVERFSEKRPLDAVAPSQPLYASVDLDSYLREKTAGRLGVFFVRVTETDPRRPNAPVDEEYYGGAEDSRLVLVTDLGLLVKRALDGSQDVFVQSLRSGQPVAGAKVDLVGRNGITVQSATTDAGGRARFESADRLRREKAPLMFVVEKDGDLSFLPLNRGDRQLDFSRFDIGGAGSSADADALSAYLFSDRGIYRPGDTVHIGAIVRTQNWQAGLDGVPLEIEVTDPRGLTLLRKPLRLGHSGFEGLDWSTRDSAPTGHYSVALYLVKNGRRNIQLGSTSVRVQEFEPDRMKVSAQLAAAPVVGWLTPAEVEARVRVMHLFGTPAAERRVQGEITLTPALPAFPRYRDYSFFDRGKLKEQFEEQLPAATTDANGEAVLDLNLQRFDRATYRLALLARAFEAEGGRNVAAYSAALVSSAPYLVGVKADGDLNYLQRDSRHSSHWLAVDAKLNAVAVADARLEWVQRKFVSVLTRQNDGTYRYQSRRKDTVRETRPLPLNAGGADIALPSAEPGDFALVLRDASGAELNRLDYSVVGAANLSRSLERNAELQLKLDKTAYRPGDTIEISIQAPYVGAGLITIERDRVYRHVWFKTDTTSSVQKIVVPEDFEGGGYVTVQFLRDPASAEIFTSPLSYGTVPFSVALDRRTEAVTVEAPARVKPGEPLQMRVTTAQPARVAVFAVDEGILQVAGYRAPDPLGFFFQKRALDVGTAQILDLLLPEFQRLLQAAAPGGDADGALGRHINPFKRKNRAPAVYWSGIIDVDAKGTTLRYDVPDYFNGRLRIFAVAVTPQTIGVFDGASEVRGDLILAPNAPAMVAPGDEFSISVSVINNAEGVSGPVTLQLRGAKGLSVIGAAQAQLDIAAQKEGTAQFRLRADDNLGAAELTFDASIGDRRARIGESISVRPALPFRTQTTVGRSADKQLTVALSRNLFAEHRQVEASYGYSPLVWSQGLTAYLDNYPYSCTEQLVSQGVPALILGARPELGRVEAKSSFDDLLQMLRSRQNGEGAFGLWAGSVEVAPWPSIYTVHFLIEAKERGRQVPADMLARGNDWLRGIAGPRGNSLDDMRLRAYAIYLLSRQGVVASELLGTLQQELDARYAKEWPLDLTAAYLAASYRLLQKTDLAEKILRKVPWAGSAAAQSADPYYDGVVHDSQLLYLLARHFPERLATVPAAQLDKFGSAISDNHYNSLSAAYLLLALDAYAGAAAAQGGTLSIAQVDAKGAATNLPLPAGVVAKAAIGAGAAKVQFGKDGDLPAFYALTEAGFDRSVPAAEVRQGLEIQRDYLDLKGKALALSGGAAQIAVGEEFLVRLRLRAIDRDWISSVAVVDLLPGGIEPVLNRAVATEDEEGVGEDAVNTPLPLGVAAESSWRPQFAEIRDDRVVLYGALSRDLATFVYRVRATNPGSFQTPAPYAEAMYKREIYARGTAGKLEIVRPE